MTTSVGFIPSATQKTVVLRTYAGNKYELPIDREEFQWMLFTYIVPRNPAMIVGFGPEQQKQYKTLRRERRQTANEERG